MNILIRLVLIHALVQISCAQKAVVTQVPALDVKQKGLGFNCKPENDGFWRNVVLNIEHVEKLKKAIRTPVSTFDLSLIHISEPTRRS